MSLQTKITTCVRQAEDDSSELKVHNYTTQNFKFCGSSIGMIKNSNLECAELEELAILEDEFLGLEKEAMCNYLKHKECPNVGDEMRKKSKQITKIRGGKPYHHDMHIEQGTKCVGNAPINKMSLKQIGC